MSEHEQYYEACQRGMFATPDARYCGCKGRGWFLSQLDTWHKCPAHYTGQPDPDGPDCELDDASDAPEAPVTAAPVVPVVETIEVDGDDIPF